MVECPRCDGQGYIYKGKVKKEIILYICDECDACWESKEKISYDSFNDLFSYLEEKGMVYCQSDIQDLGYI